MVGFIAILLVFIFVTQHSTNVKVESFEHLDRSESNQDASQTEPKKSSVLSSIKTLNDILPDADQLQDNEIIDEAELLLSMNDQSQIDDGLLILMYMSEKNNSRASYLLAQLYEKGIRIEQDDERALSFYRQAALSGSEDANIYLFNYYLDADELSDEHLLLAHQWFMEAANVAKSPIAYYALAHMYGEGLGVDPDIEQAIKFYQKAADENFVLAYEKLGNLYLLESDDPKKISDALLLFQRAANEDIATAQYKLGYMYEEGLGVKQDYETAKFWYQRAANNNLVKAYVSLGMMYENGLGVDRDNTKAVEYYRTAAELGDVVGQNTLARLFERGLGVDKDLDRAVFWYSKAAEQNDGMAAYNLGRIFEEYESYQNLVNAKHWYKKAVEHNILEANKALERLGNE